MAFNQIRIYSTGKSEWSETPAWQMAIWILSVPRAGPFFARARGCSGISFLIWGLVLREIARVDVAIYEMLTETANSGGRENRSRPKLDEDVDGDAHLGCGNGRAMAGDRFMALGLGWRV